ncbi:DUF4184 family protein [Geodermatophilus sp. SYSU D00691]
MPFTGSHPAAVLPFLRTPLPASALVIGSTAPDLPFYLPLPQWYATHTALAVVTTDLLVGLLAWAVWHGLLAAPALATAPAPLRARLAGLRTGLRPRLATGRQALLLVAALVLGAATHVLWDEFTHPRRWGPEHLPALAASWGPLPGHRWLQYASSVVGVVVLLAWSVRWWRRTPAAPVVPDRDTRWVWPLLAAVAVVAGTAAALRAGTLDDAVFPGARWAGGSALVAGVVLAAAWHAARRLRRSDEPRAG